MGVCAVFLFAVSVPNVLLLLSFIENLSFGSHFSRKSIGHCAKYVWLLLKRSSICDIL